MYKCIFNEFIEIDINSGDTIISNHKRYNTQYIIHMSIDIQNQLIFECRNKLI